ncbi:MAG: hypothetical protein H0Z37_01795 [Firmicutes bacterium]|nr:hypothetical protein [Bacillota bacterium]
MNNDQRAKLLAIAARRGLRGHSELIKEAVERYLQEEESRQASVQKVLELEGALTAEDEQKAAQRIRETWARWRP